MVQTLRVADEVHKDVKITAIKEGVTMEVLTAQWLRVAKVAPMLAAAANRFCDEAPDYNGRIDRSMVKQFCDMQAVFEDAVNAYDEAMNPEGESDG